MSHKDDENNGGDISSGFGEGTVSGPVSDEKAERMLHPDRADSRSLIDPAGDEGADTADPDADDEGVSGGGHGGGSGGGW